VVVRPEEPKVLSAQFCLTERKHTHARVNPTLILPRAHLLYTYFNQFDQLMVVTRGNTHEWVAKEYEEDVNLECQLNLHDFYGT